MPFYTRTVPHVTWPYDGALYSLTLHDFDGGFSHYFAVNLMGNTASSLGQIIHPYLGSLNFGTNPNR
jgi:hypothetical protein